jgi:hypothetical protein
LYNNNKNNNKDNNMNRRIASLLCFFASTAVSTAALEESRNLQFGGEADFFVAALDLCDNSDDPDSPPELGPCDLSRFPNCDNKSFICYNRKPSRDHFFDDNHQPIFYIQYDRVYCYPEQWAACSSCTPGRFCKSEARCILDEIDYPCAVWF